MRRRFSIIILVVFLLLFYSFPVSAYTGGLLNGNLPTLSYAYGALSGSSYSVIVDNDLNTYKSFSANEAVRWDLGSDYNIKSFKIALGSIGADTNVLVEFNRSD